MSFAFLVELFVDVEKAKRMLWNAASFAVLVCAAECLRWDAVMWVVWKVGGLLVWPLMALGIWRWISELWPKKPRPSVDN
jgi:hypothetical protein